MNLTDQASEPAAQPVFEMGSRLPSLDAGSVRLRWLTKADIPALFSIFSDPEVTRYWGFARLANLAAASALIAEIHRYFRAGTLFQWGIEACESKLVGTCTLASIDRVNRRAELGFALGQMFWDRGYMTAALPAVIDFAFQQLGLHRLYADTDPRNGPSIRILSRFGFCPEGLLREHYLVQGEPQDAVVYGLLRSEWLRAGTVLCSHAERQRPAPLRPRVSQTSRRT